MRLDRISQQLVLFLRGKAIIDELAIGRIRFELGGTFVQVAEVPEALGNALALINDLGLLEQLGEQDVKRNEEEQHQDGEGRLRHDAAFAKRGGQAVGFLGSGRAAGGENEADHVFLSLFLSVFWCVDGLLNEPESGAAVTDRARSDPIPR